MKRFLMAGGMVCASAVGLLGQTPVIHPRGVRNALSLEPAPSRATPGGLIEIRGINLGPVEGVKAEGVPWPLELGGTEVLVAGRAAPVGEVSAGRVVAQVPVETGAGLIPVVVRRGEQRSRAAYFRAVGQMAAVRTANGEGYGVAGREVGEDLVLEATGTGGVEGGEGRPPIPARAYVGGLPAEVEVTRAEARQGEQEVRVKVPAEARPGDLVTILAGNASPANRPVFRRLARPEATFVRLPQGAGAIRQLRAPDLGGRLVVGNAPRGEDGCYPTWVFDLARGSGQAADLCLIAPQSAQPTAIVGLNESDSLMALAGPAAGDVATGLTKRVAVFRGAAESIAVVELPAAVSLVAGGQQGTAMAIAPGPPVTAYTIDPVTLEVEEGASGAVVNLPGAGAGGGGAAPAAPGLTVDLGEGLNVALTPAIGVGAGMLAAVVGDDASKPTRAKLALLNARGQVTESRDWPEGWLPLVAPAPPQGPGGGVPAPGGGAVLPLVRFRTLFVFDQPTRSLYVLARQAEGAGHGFVRYAGAELESSVIRFPEGWYAAACAANLPAFNLELSRRFALFGTRRAEEGFRAVCTAQGYLALEFASGRVAAVALPGAGEVNLATPNGDVNDYLFATNSDAVNRAISDTLYVLDSTAETAFRLDLPVGVAGFTNVIAVPQLGALIATGTNRQAGDGGLIYFDLENERTRVFPVPEGFQSISYAGLFPSTRRLVARGLRPNNAGSQYLVFDLESGDLVMVDNPPGVAFVGPLPAQPAVPGGGGGGGAGAAPAGTFQIVNSKANQVVAMGFDENRQPVGIVGIRIP